MTYMIPQLISEDINSSGERIIFKELKDAPGTDNWKCLHSLGIAKHIENVYGEIDFVLLIPNQGVFCLEVKSGRVSRNDGVWEYRNKHGRLIRDWKGPIKQVVNACFSLRKSIEDKFGPEHHVCKLIYWWGVVFPQCPFDKTGTECEMWQIYNSKDRERPITEFINNLAKETHEKMKSQPWYVEGRTRPSNNDISAVVEFLRGNFEFYVKKGLEATELQKQILRFTSEQARCLDSLRANRQCFFSGAAGTGKTVLSIEFARREAQGDKRVLLLCPNILLANESRFQLSEFSDRITIDTFHNYLEKLVLHSQFKEEFLAEKNKLFSHDKSEADKNNFFKETYPYYASLALTDREDPFDVLILDQAEDLISSSYLDVMDGLLKGGLKSGRWAFFGDLCGQKIYTNLTPEQMREEISRRAPSHTQFSLIVNCRNTKSISSDTCRLVGFDESPFLPSSVSGPPVSYEYYSEESQVPEKLRLMVIELANEGIQRDSITILSPYPLKNSLPDNPERKCGFKVFDITANNPLEVKKNEVRFSTISAFKGLESPVVIIIGMTDLDSDVSKDLLYVAMSRALIRLFMILPASLEKQVKRLLK
jgi:hypothetical protein